MKSSIVTYPDQQFAIGPGKRLSDRNKYEDWTERLFTVCRCTGNYRLSQVSEGLRVHRGTVFTDVPSIESFFTRADHNFFSTKMGAYTYQFSRLISTWLSLVVS